MTDTVAAQTDTAAEQENAAGDAGTAPEQTAEEGAGNGAASEEQGQQAAEESAGQASGETDGDDGNEAEGGEQDDGGADPYADLTIPEDVQVDEEAMAQFKQIASEADLPPEAAQKLIDLQVGMQQRQMEDLLESYQAQLDGWAEAVKKDEEIGGAGPELDRKIAAAKEAMDRFTTPEFRKLLQPYHPKENPEGMGLGNHPEMIRLFYRLATQVNEDGVLLGGAAAEPRSREEVLYGN